MQRSFTGAQALLGSLILRNGVCLLGSTSRLTSQCSFSTQLSESSQTSQRPGQASATPVAVTLSWSSPAPLAAERKLSGKQPVASSPAARVIYVRPSVVKRRAEAALRIKAKASLKAAKDKVELIERNAASKAKQMKISDTAAKLKAARNARTTAARATLTAAKTKKRMVAINVAARVKARLKAKNLQAIQVSTKLKAEVIKRKEEAKVQAAKAKAQKAKAEAKQKEDLRVKRSPTPYILFLTERVKAISHLPVSERFKTIGMQYRGLTPEQRQPYLDAAAKRKTETDTQRAAVKAAKVPVTSAYLLFFQKRTIEIKATGSSAKFGEIGRLLGKEWRGLGDSEKQLLQAQAVIRNKNAVLALGDRVTSPVSAAV